MRYPFSILSFSIAAFFSLGTHTAYADPQTETELIQECDRLTREHPASPAPVPQERVRHRDAMHQICSKWERLLTIEVPDESQAAALSQTCYDEAARGFGPIPLRHRLFGIARANRRLGHLVATRQMCDDMTAAVSGKMHPRY